jgi:hypothetical protein
MPKGYPQRHMYKPPKIDPVKFQMNVTHDQFKGSKSRYYEERKEKELLVYQNQAKEVPPETLTKRKKRSMSEEFETLKFKDPIDGEKKHLLERRDDIFKPI